LDHEWSDHQHPDSEVGLTALSGSVLTSLTDRI
jgi:hypothetical protein